MKDSRMTIKSLQMTMKECPEWHLSFPLSEPEFLELMELHEFNK